MSAGDFVKEPHSLAIKVAERVRLKAVGNDPEQEVARQVRGCGAAEQLAPADPQSMNVEPLKARDLVFDRNRAEQPRAIKPWPDRHGAERRNGRCSRCKRRGEEIVAFHSPMGAYYATKVELNACHFNALFGSISLWNGCRPRIHRHGGRISA